MSTEHAVKDAPLVLSVSRETSPGRRYIVTVRTHDNQTRRIRLITLNPPPSELAVS